MKKTTLCALAAGALVLTGATARAHDDEDGVTQVDRYPGADVVHYDHHHRQYYTDEYGNLVEQTVHHDHHYVVPRENHHYFAPEENRYYGRGYHRRHYRRPFVNLFFGGY
jgi:hypothetical protein